MSLQTHLSELTAKHRALESQIEEEASSQGNRRLPVLTKRVAKLATEEPEQLARIVRGWMAEDQR